MIERFDKETAADLGECKVVAEGDLHNLTSAGWHLVAMMDQAIPGMSSSKTVFNPNPSAYPQTATDYEYGPPLNVTKYLIARSKDDTMSTLASSRDAAAAAEVAAQKEVKTLKEALVLLQEVVDSRQATINYTETRAKSAYEQAANERKIRERLETDLGKLREAIGSKQFKDIVGEEKAATT